MDYYEISSLQHPIVKHLVRLRQNSSYRWDHQSVVIEGIKLTTEINALFKAKTIVTCDQHLLPKEFDAEKIYFTTPNVLKKISGLLHPEGILAEFPIQPAKNFAQMRSILVLDSINDPGNLGNLLRTALALGWEGAYMVGENCDPYNEKAIRASRGACLKLPIHQGSWDDLKLLIQRDSSFAFVADLSGLPPSAYKKLDPNQHILLILSSEAHGPSPEAFEWCQPVSIPLAETMESLNVAAAGAILMYLFQPHFPS